MSQVYSDPTREDDPHSLPDVEVFHLGGNEVAEWYQEGWEDITEPGWYWWPCFPGCLPDGEPIGPFASEEEATADAQNG